MHLCRITNWLILQVTDDVFTYWVNSELRTSMRSSKGIIPVVETDPRHGGVSVEKLRSQCPKGIAAVLFDQQKPIKWHREVRRIHRAHRSFAAS